MDPVGNDIVSSPENDAGNMDCDVEECYSCWRWLSRLGGLRNAHGRVKVRSGPVLKRRRKKKSCNDYFLERDKNFEGQLCQQCWDHMEQYYHGGLCGALFTINRPLVDDPKQQSHHELADGTSTSVFEECVARSGQS